MLPDGHAYTTLIVSSSERINEGLRPLMPAARCAPVTYVGNISAAKRAVAEVQYDFIIINAPLPDDMGTRFAIELSGSKSCVVLLLLSSDVYEEVRSRVTPYGVFTLQKPTNVTALSQGLAWMAPARERLRKLESKTVSIEKKMEEIRLVNKAKWVLIQSLGMSEPEAHRYIEKQAMDTCVTKREVAESIIRTYG